MTDQPKRAYEVLELGEPDIETKRAFYIHLGIVNAHSADAAIEAVAQKEQVAGRYVAVPQTNWNERDVEVTQVPKIEVAQVGAAPQLVPDEAPEDLPPAA